MTTDVTTLTDEQIHALRKELSVELQARIDRAALPAAIEDMTRRLKAAKDREKIQPTAEGEDTTDQPGLGKGRALKGIVEVVAELEPESVQEVAATLPATEPAPVDDPPAEDPALVEEPAP